MPPLDAGEACDHASVQAQPRRPVPTAPRGRPVSRPGPGGPTARCGPEVCTDDGAEHSGDDAVGVVSAGGRRPRSLAVADAARHAEAMPVLLEVFTAEAAARRPRCIARFCGPSIGRTRSHGLSLLRSMAIAHSSTDRMRWRTALAVSALTRQIGVRISSTSAAVTSETGRRPIRGKA